MNKKIEKRDYENVYHQIKLLMEEARSSVVLTVNTTLIKTYYEIGKTIVENEQGHIERAEYGKGLLLELSRRLTKEFGRGFSRSNLQKPLHA